MDRTGGVAVGSAALLDFFGASGQVGKGSN
jgi:hypothetical protein